MNEIVAEFLVETAENLDQLDRDLVALEADPTSNPLLASVFRTFHTVKGTTGFLGFSRLETLSHAAESLLQDLREERLVLTRARTDVLLEVVDAVRGLLAAIEATGEEDERDLSGVLDDLERCRRAEETAVEPPDHGDLHAPAGRAPVPAASERSVRVDVDLLDRILREVGELVLARNHVGALAASTDDPALRATVQRLSAIVSELQEDVTRTRMQPVGQLFAKLPRVVRDLAAQSGKDVGLVLEGEETELDRSLLEAVKDPLTHLVRNAVDHGLETPEARRAAGKEPRGTLRLRASHEGGQVLVEVDDDGAGIDPATLRAHALERGLLSAAELASLSEREVVELVFRPGFSTAESVTNVSGRGVGMDVVRTNVERLGGSVDLVSVTGVGTTVRVRIPLTLAIVPALLIACGGQRYAIARGNVLEVVQLRPEDASARLERVEEALVCHLRDGLLPVVRLADVLSANGDRSRPAGGEPDGRTIVVVQADGLLFGVLLDEVVGTEEIVVKPLGRHLQQIPVFTGATILEDGSVALILDVPGLVAGMPAPGSSRRSVAEASPAPATGAAARASYVLLRVGERRRVAVPLAAVDRIEEAPSGALEHTAGRLVLQYHGELLPLAHLADLLGEPPADAPRPGHGPARVPVLVATDGRRRLGLLSSEVLDVVEGAFELDPVGAGPALAGSTVVDGHATDVLDVEAALERAEVAGRVA